MVNVVILSIMVDTSLYALLIMQFTLFSSERHCCLEYNSSKLTYCASITWITFYRIPSQVNDSTSYLLFFDYILLYFFVTTNVIFMFVIFVCISLVTRYKTTATITFIYMKVLATLMV